MSETEAERAPFSRDKAEDEGWVFDTSHSPLKATLGGHDPRVQRFGGNEAELVQAIDDWNLEQLSRKPEARHSFFRGGVIGVGA